MTDLAAEHMHADPRLDQARQLIAQALADSQTKLDGPRPADPARFWALVHFLRVAGVGVHAHRIEFAATVAVRQELVHPGESIHIAAHWVPGLARRDGWRNERAIELVQGWPELCRLLWSNVAPST